MEEFTSPAIVGVTVTTPDGHSSEGRLCVIRAVSLNVVDTETARTELTVIVEDNEKDNHVVRFGPESIGRVMLSAGVNMYEDLPGRLVYASGLLEGRPVLVNPFIYAAVRGSHVPLGTPPGELELEDAQVGHGHG
jgi:hypothetical protein